MKTLHKVISIFRICTMQKNSVGRIMPNISYKIVDHESGNSVDTGTPGELLLK